MRDVTQGSGTKAMVDMNIVRLMGGLGNQMFQYALGLRLARETGRPVAYDGCNGFSRDLCCRRLALTALSVEMSLAPERAIPLGMSWGSPWHRVAKLYWSHAPVRRRVVYERTPFQYEAAVLARSSHGQYFHGYWQHEDYFAPVAAELREHFRLRDRPSPAFLALQEEMAQGGSISVHVRNYHDRGADGKILAQSRAHHGACSWDYYREAVERIGGGVGRVCHVFSDDPEWTKAHLRLPVPCHYIAGRGAFSDVEEMQLMASCQHHVIANSSFSWWGAWLGRNPDKVVVAPRTWIRGVPEGSVDVCPRSWVRI